MKKLLLSGWQRISVVVSVLWIVGWLVWLHVIAVNGASESYIACRDYHPTWTWEQCHVDPVYFTSENDVRAFVLVVFIGLALFWILGGLTFWTIRWIGRGFARVK